MVIILPSHKANYEFSFYRIFAIIHEVSQKVEHLFKKWSTFPKSESKSDASSRTSMIAIKKGESKSGVLFQKVSQKVTHLYKY